MIVSAVEGFLLGGGLIIAIGAQNAFILRQGLLKQFVFPLCLVASLADSLLIIAGVAGLGTLVKANDGLLFWVTLGGAAFLTLYAIQAFIRAMRPQALEAARGGAKSLKSALATLAAFTFLNPHVYLDTVVLVGGISGTYEGATRTYFAAGACLASFVWFFSLGYGARLLQPLFANPAAWRALDFLIALIMALLAFSLVMRAFG